MLPFSNTREKLSTICVHFIINSYGNNQKCQKGLVRAGTHLRV